MAFDSVWFGRELLLATTELGHGHQNRDGWGFGDRSPGPEAVPVEVVQVGQFCALFFPLLTLFLFLNNFRCISWNGGGLHAISYSKMSSQHTNLEFSGHLVKPRPLICWGLREPKRVCAASADGFGKIEKEREKRREKMKKRRGREKKREKRK